VLLKMLGRFGGEFLGVGASRVEPGEGLAAEGRLDHRQLAQLRGAQRRLDAVPSVIFFS
jgi:hypothetical protein